MIPGTGFPKKIARPITHGILMRGMTFWFSFFLLLDESGEKIRQENVYGSLC